MKTTHVRGAVTALLAAAGLLAFQTNAFADTTFVDHPNAVEQMSGWTPWGDGLHKLIPVGDCADAVGGYNNGYGAVPVFWTPGAACTSLALSPKPHDPVDGVPSYDHLNLRDGVLLDDGSVLAVGADREHNDGYFSYGFVIKRLPNGTAQQLGSYSPPDGRYLDFNAIVRVGQSVVIAGDRSENGVNAGAVWTSTDNGVTLHQVQLPAATSVTTIAALAVDGNTVVATGNNGVMWSSADGGNTWTQAAVNGLPSGPVRMSGVAKTASGWLAVGYGPVALTSQDGTTWTAADASAFGTANIDGITVNKAGNPVVVGDANNCGQLWTGDGSGGWTSTSLGCTDVPTAVTALSDGRIMVAGVHDIWLQG